MEGRGGMYNIIFYENCLKYKQILVMSQHAYDIQVVSLELLNSLHASKQYPVHKSGPTKNKCKNLHR